MGQKVVHKWVRKWSIHGSKDSQNSGKWGQRDPVQGHSGAGVEGDPDPYHGGTPLPARVPVPHYPGHPTHRSACTRRRHGWVHDLRGLSSGCQAPLDYSQYLTVTACTDIGNTPCFIINLRVSRQFVKTGPYLSGIINKLVKTGKPGKSRFIPNLLINYQ